MGRLLALSSLPLLLLSSLCPSFWPLLKIMVVTMGGALKLADTVEEARAACQYSERLSDILPCQRMGAP